jgi:exo-beta-1,3-glucanase (GH17 family)
VKSIRSRLTAWTLVVVSLFLAVDGVILYWMVRGKLVEERDQNLVVLAHSAGSVVHHELRGVREVAGRGEPRYALEGVAFSPWGPGQDPNQGSKVKPQLMWDRLQLIRDDALVVRTYGVDGGLEDAGWLLHMLGRRTVIGAWIGPDEEANAKQLATLVRLSIAGDVDVAVVGSEVLYRGDLESWQLLDLLRQAREQIPAHIPVTTADTWRSFLDNPELLPAVDLVYANYYPYWEGVPIEDAVQTLAGWHDELLTYAQGKPVMVSEAGWPSAGDSIGKAQATEENAARFFLEFVSWAVANDVRYTYFTALDEAWKAAYEGPQGAHWGYRDTDGRLKPGMQAVFDGLRVDAGEPSLELTHIPDANGDEELRGLVSGVGTLLHHVAILIEVNGVWYTKPSYASPVSAIAANGVFHADITTGPGDEEATAFAAFLFPQSFLPPPADGISPIPAVYYEMALEHLQVQR